MERYKPKKFWNHYFVLVIVIYLLTTLVIRLLDNTLAIFAKAVADSESYGGNLTTFFTLGSVIASTFCGRLIDQTKRRWILLASLVLFSVSVFLCAIATDKWHMYALRVFQGMSKAGFMVTSGAMVADVVPRERVGEGIGYYGFGQALSMAIGPLVGLVLVADGNFSFLFCVAGGALALAAVLSLTLNYEGRGPIVPAAKKEKSDAPSDEKGLWKFIEKKAIPASLVQFFGFAGSATIIVFAMLYATDALELGLLPIALFYALMAVTMFIMRILSGKAVDRGNAVTVPVICLAGAIVAYILLGFFAPGSVVLYVLAGGFYGLCHGGLTSAMNAQAILASPPERKGAAMATFNLFMDLGIFVSSFVLGLVLEHSGYPLLFTCGAVCAATALVLTVIFFRKKK